MAEALFNRLSFEERMGMALSLRGKERERLILLARDAQKIVQRLPEEEFYYTVKEIGEGDAIELLSLASARQLLFLFDIETWRKDRLKHRDFLKWIELILECGEGKAIELLRGMDEELLVTFLKRYMKVYKPDAEIDPVEIDEEKLFTLDNQYFVKFRFREGERVLGHLLDLLFREDQDLYFRLMEGVIWGVPAEVEELAFRWRQSRLMDRGFPELEESLDLYRYVDPEMIRIDEGTKDLYPPDEEMTRWGEITPNFYLAPLPSGLFLQEVLKVASEEGMEWLGGELVYLCNKAMVAEGVDPSNLEEVRELLDRVYGYLNLGLSHLSQGRLDEGIRGVKKLYLHQIFQVGFSLTLRLGRRAKRTLRSPWYRKGKEDLGLLDSPWREVMEGLLRKRPLLYEGIMDNMSSLYRPFRELKEIKAVEEVLDEVSFLSRLHGEVYGYDPEVLHQMDLSRCHPGGWEEITFGTITLTSLANLALDEEFAFRPIPEERLKELLSLTLSAGEGGKVLPSLHEGFLQKVRECFKGISSSLTPKEREMGWRFWQKVLKDYCEEFGYLDTHRPINPRFTKGLLIKLRG